MINTTTVYNQTMLDSNNDYLNSKNDNSLISKYVYLEKDLILYIQ